MTDVTGLFSLTKSPQALPGKCGGCGRATDNLGFIDTGLQFDYYGALLFCSECVLTMASKFGYITTEVADKLISKVAELETETIIQRDAILKLEEALDGLQAARDALSTLRGSTSDKPVDEPEIKEVSSTEETGNRDSVVEEPESITASGNSETDRLISEQEPVGVSSNPSNLVNLDELEF